MIRCTQCTFFKQSCQGFIECNFISGRGDKTADVMVVFDSPFFYDVQSECIASDKQYNTLFNKYLELIGLSLDKVYVTTFIKCFISDKKKKPTKQMKTKCFELYLEKEIQAVKPKVVLVIGRMVTQWFIPDVTARVPLRQVIGQSFYNTNYNCHVIPLYDMFYLTNFSNKSAQVKQTERALALANTLRNKEKVTAKTIKVPYETEIEALDELGDYVACDLETTGLNPRKDIIITVALTDVKTKKTVSFDAEAYGAVEVCPKCHGEKTIEITEKKKKGKQLIEQTVVQECDKCRGNGKVFVKDFKKSVFFTRVLPACASAMKSRKIIFQNAIFDLQMLWGAGYDVFDNLVSDTRMMQFLLNPLGANALGFLVQLYYGIAYKDEIDREHILAMDMEDRRYYCAEDTYYTARLFCDLYKKLKDNDCLTSNKILTDVIKIIASDLEYYGIKIDESTTYEIIDFYQAEKEKCETQFKKRFDLPDEFNLNSPKQLCKLLYEDLGLPVMVRTKTKNKTGEFNPSTNEEAINKLASKRPALKGLVDYRTNKGHVEKLRGYLSAIDIDGRIHGSFNPFSPDSSRLMNSKPNYQNVPRQSRLKEIFIPKQGYSYVYYDYSQIEFRVWLHLANDKQGLKFVNEGRDIHAFIASQFYREPEEKFLNPYRKEHPEYAEKRNKVKTIVYGSMYGRTPEGIVREHGGSVEEAAGIQRIFFDLCREGWMWLQQLEQQVFRDKRLVTPFGTPRIFNDIELADKSEREKIIREAKSFIVQSWAVEMVFIGMYKVWSQIRKEGLDAHYIHQIHDAGILEVKDENLARVKQIVLDLAQSPYSKLKVPLEVELKTGKSWDEVA